MFSGAAAGDGCGSFVAPRKDFAHTAGCVFGGNAPETRMSDEKTFALSKSHGMGSHGTDGIEGRARAAYEAMLNREDSFRNHPETASKK